MASYVPMYSTHDHERKTHIAADDNGASLCGIEKRYPDLLWTTGSVYYDIDSQFFIDDPDRPRGCRRCGQIYRKSHQMTMNNKDTEAPARSYKDHLREQITNAEEATGYLSACYVEGPETFALAVKDVWGFARVDPPAAPADPVLAALMKACPVCRGPFNACDCMPLVVTWNGIPCEDQAAALKEFKQACTPVTSPTPDEADKALAQQTAEAYFDEWGWPPESEIVDLMARFAAALAQARSETWEKAIEIAQARCDDVPVQVDFEDDKNAFVAGYAVAAGSIKDALQRALNKSASKSHKG